MLRETLPAIAADPPPTEVADAGDHEYSEDELTKSIKHVRDLVAMVFAAVSIDARSRNIPDSHPLLVELGQSAEHFIKVADEEHTEQEKEAAAEVDNSSSSNSGRCRCWKCTR